MPIRLAALALLVAAVLLSLNLWPLPDDTAKARVAFWTDLKAQWEARDPAKTENPRWAEDAKAKSLAEINTILSDTEGIYWDARVVWVLWLLAAFVTAAAGFAAWKSWRHWRWLALASLGAFLWLQRPFQVLGSFFYSDNGLDIGQGMSRLGYFSQHTGAFWEFVVFNVVLPLVLVAVAALAFWRARTRRSVTNGQNAL